MSMGAEPDPPPDQGAAPDGAAPDDAAPDGADTILLINPNTSARALAMMLAAAAPHLPPGLRLRGVCAAAGVPMIVTEADLRVSAAEVVRLGRSAAVRAIVVAAFGDPGVEALRALVSVPVIGLGAAAIAEAAAGGRRFGIATTTPRLAGAIARLVARLSLSGSFTGTRVPGDDPLVLAGDPARQEIALAAAARLCFTRDGAQAVIIGGGPLSAAARSARVQDMGLIIEPVPAAIRRAVRLLAGG